MAAGCAARTGCGREDSASLVGDEALLYAPLVPTWVGGDRRRSAQAAVAAGADVLVMDDGLQNAGLRKHLSLLVIDGGTGFGNGRVLPAGPLREPVAAAASRCQAAVLIGEDATGALARLPAGLPVLRARLEPGPQAAILAGRRVLAFTGIAVPEKFFASLTAIGSDIVSRQSFPDHHLYTAAERATLLAEAERLGAIPVTTAKDAARLPAAMRAPGDGAGGGARLGRPGGARCAARSRAGSAGRPSASMRHAMHDLVFLFDVDNTLLDNDRVQHDLSVHLAKRVRSRGARPVLGACSRSSAAAWATPTTSAPCSATGWRRCTTRKCCASPTGWRIIPSPTGCIRRRWRLVARAQSWGPTVILSDGDAAFQPRKVERSGLWRAFGDHVLIFVHKEQSLDCVERLYPARRYVMIDDKLRILQALKGSWGDRVTTVFPRQGHYALEPGVETRYLRPDLRLERIGDLLRHARADFAGGAAG